MVKITFIGAGSIVFAKNIITDILSFPALRKETTICLEDIDEKRLNLMKRYLEKYKHDNPEPMKNVQIQATLDQKKSVEGARYIVCAVQVGGMDAYGIDMDIPKKYGVHQVVGDSLGPGGIFRFLRTTPFYRSILKDIHEVAEKSHNSSLPLFLNYTNPMCMNTWFCNSLYPDSTVGLCHGVQGTSNYLKTHLIGALGADKFSFLCAGINHMAWFLKLLYKDPEKDPEQTGPWMDAYPLIKEHLDEEPRLGEDEGVRIDMMKATGYFMTESSGHLAEYLPYYLKNKKYIEKYRSPNKQGFETLEQSYYYKEGLVKADKLDEDFRRAFESEKLVFKATPSQEYGSRIINAIETGEPFIGNFNVMNKNQGLIINLPKDCCVEVPISVDEAGLHPQGGIELPPVCQALCMSNIMVQQAAVKGALSGNKELIYHATMLDPNTQSVLCPEEIRAMVDEMIKAEQKWLPSLK